MSYVDNLLRNYERQVSIPWDDYLSGQEKVWFLIYPPQQERRVRKRLADFEAKTREHKHSWHYLDFTDAFAKWMGAHEYRDAYFEDPEYVSDSTFEDFRQQVVDQVVGALASEDNDDQTVVAIGGTASLWDFASLSEIILHSADEICGRLVVFFPGEHEGTSYRHLNAPGGFDYLAVPITGK